MKTTKMVLAGVLIGLSIVNPVLAAEKACLQNNRIWGWQAIDQRTLLLTDRSYKRFTVHLTGGCIGLDKYAGVGLVVRSKTSLGCLSQGDSIVFNSPGLGPLSCFVMSVDEGTPSTPPA